MTDGYSKLYGMDTHANRGKTFERAIRKLFASYERRGIHCQQNHPEQLHDGTLVKRHGFDFQVFCKGSFYAFDAKECALKSFPVDKVKPHQLKALLDVENNGGHGFFLVRFTSIKKTIRFDASVIQKALIDGAKSISPDYGVETSINILGV